MVDSSHSCFRSLVSTGGVGLDVVLAIFVAAVAELLDRGLPQVRFFSGIPEPDFEFFGSDFLYDTISTKELRGGQGHYYLF